MLFIMVKLCVFSVVVVDNNQSPLTYELFFASLNFCTYDFASKTLSIFIVEFLRLNDSLINTDHYKN